MVIAEWFDITNMDHIRAYKHLMDEGCWPEGFIPDHVERPAGWQVALMAIMANAYMEMRIGENMGHGRELVKVKGPKFMGTKKVCSETGNARGSSSDETATRKGQTLTVAEDEIRSENETDPTPK